MKNILLTGASKGLGLTIVKKLIAKPDHRIFCVNRNLTPDLEKLMKEHAERLFFQSLDLTQPGRVQKTIFNDFLSNKIAIHSFINNAAFAYDDIISNLNLDKLDEMFRVNVYSPMNMTKYVLRNMLLNKTQGSIVHVSSISVHTGYKGLAMYASSKGALEAFSKNTAREWGELGIRSNCLVAGFMETPMSASLNEEQKTRIYKRTSLKCPTSTESVADTIAFLISDESKSITGQNIFVDCGTI